MKANRSSYGLRFIFIFSTHPMIDLVYERSEWLRRSKSEAQTKSRIGKINEEFDAPHFVWCGSEGACAKHRRQILNRDEASN